jgi:hypothetical protein
MKKSRLKAISQETLFIIFILFIFVVTSLIIFSKWNESVVKVANEESCREKVMKYCLSLINKENPNWDEMLPKGCEKFGIGKPTEKDCREMLQ